MQLNKLLAAFVCTMLGLTAAQAVDLERKIDFKISSQPLSSALVAFAEQTKLQIMTANADLKAYRAPKLEGKFTVRAALREILAGTDLKFREVGEGTLTIGRPAKLKSWADGLGSDNAAAVTYLAAANIAYGNDQAENETSTVAQVGSQSPVSAEDGVSEMIVEGERERRAPFSDANVDLPRTINDAQPYYIFDNQTITRSAATNIEDFLKQRLTMNTRIKSSIQGSHGSLGNTSQIDLRGLGPDKTLILVNGRRMAGVTWLGRDFQPDLNGIPLTAVERIEVLPSSASGIYGGSAMGGVVNVILKSDYSGGEVRALYDNSWDTDSSKRTLSAAYGMSLEGGRTRLRITGQYSDANSLLLRDRREIYDRNRERVQQADPNYFYSPRNPFWGALPNIISRTYTPPYNIVDGVFYPDNLVLKDGTPLDTYFTQINAGTDPSISMTELSATLLANKGSWNLELPDSTQVPNGLRRQLFGTPETESLQIALQRQMSPRIEAFLDFSYYGNDSSTVYNHYRGGFYVPSTAPTNPFTSAVLVIFPSNADIPHIANSTTRSIGVGLKAKLPHDWIGQLDYTWSRNNHNNHYSATDSSAYRAAINTGELNPFVDTLAHPMNLEKFLIPVLRDSESTMRDVALRGSGPLFALPGGPVQLTVGLEHRIGSKPDNIVTIQYPLTPAQSYKTVYYASDQATNSLYAEAQVPLIAPDRIPLVHALDLQLSGRIERYTVDTGTKSARVYYERDPVDISYSGTTLNGGPYFSEDTYSSKNYTLGLRYQPIAGLMLRASRATAFLPPTPDQLLSILEPNPRGAYVRVDPQNPNWTAGYVAAITGGNPDLKPQHSKSWNAGIVWEPQLRVLQGFRFNAEYYRIEQFDSITSLSSQTILDNESLYQGRVTRDANGVLTLLDLTMTNLFHRETEGWDISMDYRWRTPIGAFNLNAVGSIILHLKNQYSLSLPEYDAVNFPSEGGAGKYKGNATLNWARGAWNAAWSARYFGSYKQYGADGGPYATQNPSPTGYYRTYYRLRQGGDSIPSQIYHDLFVSYDFGNAGATRNTRGVIPALLSGVTLQAGVRNVFDKVPPYDFYYSFSQYFLSPYGDTRLRSYWLSLTKAF